MKTAKGFSGTDSRKITYKIGDAFKYSHNSGFRHLDIKPNIIIKHNIKYKSANEIKLVPSRIYSIYWDVASKTPVRIKTELIKADRVARHRNTCHQKYLDKKHAMDQRCGCLKLGNLGKLIERKFTKSKSFMMIMNLVNN